MDEIDTLRAYERYEQTSLRLIVHHPKLGIALKEQMDRLGIECIVQYQDAKSGQLIRDAEDVQTVTPVEFIRKHFIRAAGRTKQ